MPGREVRLDEVEVDGVVGVLGVVAVEVSDVAGGEVLHCTKVVDKEAFGWGGPGGYLEFVVVEEVAIAVVAPVFANTGVGIAGVVNGAVPAEFDVLGKAALGFDLGGVRFGVGLGCCLGIRSLILGVVVEAEAEEFFSGGEPVAGFEVGELALHSVDEEADGGAAEVGFIVNDLGKRGADAVRRVGVLRVGLSLRLGARTGCWGAPRSGVVEEGLGGLEAEFDEEPGGVEAMAGLGIGEFAVHGGDEEADDETAVLSFLSDDAGNIRHMF